MIPFGGRQVRTERYDVAAEVVTVELHHRDGSVRHLPVRRHGHVVALWSSRRPPVVRFVDAGGTALAERRPGRNERMWSLALPSRR